jgi:outer membrane putative beta-barrel porin/alpha-amylase
MWRSDENSIHTTNRLSRQMEKRENHVRLTHSTRSKSWLALVSVAAALAPIHALAQQDAAALAKAAQNPIADMISVPFQYNANFKTGPLEKTQSVLNIQPVYPIDLNSEWNLITRTIVPLIWQPEFVAGEGRENGIGDIQFSAFLSPKQPTAGGWILGAGVVAQLDTASDDRLGQGAWGLGPTAVALRIDGKWVYGGLFNNIWSVSRDDNRAKVNQMLFQPFINYNFPDHPGRYLSFSPIITANWEASGGDRWTVPLGIGIGQIMRFGKQPVNLQAAAYYNVARPDFAPQWNLRLQAQFLFPK